MCFSVATLTGGYRMFGFFKRKPARQHEQALESQAADPIDRFWAWVLANRSGVVAEVQAFGTDGASSNLAVSELGDRLKRIDPGLAHEVGMADPGTLEIVISAEGFRELFPTVLEVVKRAPDVSGLKVTAFRQRNPGMSLEVLAQTMTAEDVSYVSQREGEKIGLDVFFDVDLDERARTMIGFLMLDMALGEYDVGTALGSIEFQEGRPPADAKRLSELAEEVDAARTGMTH